MDAAEDAIHVIIPIFCVATMFAMGLDVTLAEAVAPLRQMLALGITVLVNSVLIPLLGFLIIALPALLAADWLANPGLKDLALTGGAQMGFLLLILASGSLLGPTLARIAGADETTAKGVMVVLAVASIVLVPIELKLLCSSNAISACKFFGAVDAGAVFMLLLLFQLLPLVVGLAIKARYDAVAVRLRLLIMQLMGLSLLVLLALLVMSRYQVFQAPGEVQPVSTELFSSSFTSEDSPSTWPMTDGAVLAALQNLNWDASLKRLENLAVVQLTDGRTSTWTLVEGSRTYTVVLAGTTNSTIPPLPRLDLSGPNSLKAQTSPSFTLGVVAAVIGLNTGGVSSNLREDFAKQHLMLSSDLATTLGGTSGWMLTDADETYFVEGESKDGKVAKLTLYQFSLSPLAPSQAQAEPVEFLGGFLAFLEEMPVVSQIVSFLAQFIVLLLPYALLAALVALLLLIGKYTGVAVRNVVGVSGEGIPRAMAISTAVRNVSIALLLANQYYSVRTDFGAIAIVLVFYLVSLIVTAHEAVTWGKESVAQPVAVTDVTSIPAM